MTSKPTLRFRIYCDPKHRKSSPFFYVSIWRTLPIARERMVELAHNPRNRRRANEALACCYSWRQVSCRGKGKPKLMQEMGELVFPESYCGSGTISHECTHAAIAYIDRLKEDGKRLVLGEEERLCIVVGALTRQIVRRLCARDARIKKAKAEGTK